MCQRFTEGGDLDFEDGKVACERQPVETSLSETVGSGVEPWSEGKLSR